MPSRCSSSSSKNFARWASLRPRTVPARPPRRLTRSSGFASGRPSYLSAPRTSWARAFKPLFVVPAVIVVLAAFVAADIWLFFAHGVAQAVRQALYHPGLFLPLFFAVVLTAAFHEIGHAAACRFGGGRPGKMGCGLYLAWPAFYTDVTDAYRLGKRARLRTDLGGVYFNVVVVLITVAAYFATGFEPLLLLVLIQHFEIAHQLLPVVRLDGYYIVCRPHRCPRSVRSHRAHSPQPGARPQG